MLTSQLKPSQSGSALVIGAGPAGMLAALLLSRHDFRVALTNKRPAPFTDRSRWHHVHAIGNDAWSALCALTPGLAEEMTRRGAPLAPADAYSLDGSGSVPQRVFPTRRMLDQGLMALCERDTSIQISDRERFNGAGRSVGAPLRNVQEFDLVVDCSGTGRASLPLLPDACAPVIIEDVTEGAHASLHVAGVRWPDGYVGHAAQDAEGLGGCMLRRCADTEALLTLLLPDTIPLPADPPELLAMLDAFPDVRVAELVREARPLGPVHHWRNKRMSRIAFEGESLPDGWLALGDALLQTPPRQGLGLSQLSQQLEVMAEGLASNAPAPDLLVRLLAQSRARFDAACLAQHLREQALPTRWTGQAIAPAVESVG